MPRYIEIALAAPIAQTYTYIWPARIGSEPRIGQLVLASSGRTAKTGFVIGLDPTPPPGIKIQEIRALEQEEPLFSDELLRVLRWASAYYRWPLGDCLRTALPAGLRRKSKRIVSLTELGKRYLARETAGPLFEQMPDASHPLADLVLAHIRDAGPQEVSKLLAAFPRKLGEAGLASLEREGYLERREEVAAGVKPRLLLFYRAVAGIDSKELAELEKRAPRQAALLLYLHRMGDVARNELSKAMPSAAASLKALESKGLVERFEQERSRDPIFDFPAELREQPTLNAEQASALAAISKALQASAYQAFLLQGITGSGKTELYLRVIEQVLELGRDAICLVPEIALTPQFVGRFRARFGDALAVMHSELSEGERFDQWRKVRDGKVRIAIGARSAVFAPFRKLGLIVVDEEHEESYKQEDRLRYHARDLALVRAKENDAIAILGSATPSLESAYNADQGRYQHLVLSQRAVPGASLPKVELIDLRQPENRPPKGGSIGPRLNEALAETLLASKQALVLINRRGFSPALLCRDCGNEFHCPDCAVGMTLHRRRSILLCHYCGYQQHIPDICPECRSHDVIALGAGSEAVADEVAALFPKARVGRLDRDIGAMKGGRGRVLAELARGELDILVGTQMIAKGLDFPRVALVGVVLADLSLNFPDFRCGERTFSLMTQVAGRSGRAQDAGRVVIQTYCPEHPALTLAAEHDYFGFYREELENRRELNYPPFQRVALVLFSGKDEALVSSAATALAKALPPVEGVQFYPANPMPIARIRGLNRWSILLKAQGFAELRRALQSVEAAALSLPPGVRMVLDVDAHSML